MIEAIHTAVPGRARFRVEGLGGSSFLRGRLESVLADQGNFTRIRVSDVTGTVLVRFNSGATLETVERLLDAVVRQARRDEPGNGSSGGAASARSDAAAGRSEEGPLWYRMATERVLDQLRSDLQVGLDEEAVLARRAEHGPNVIVEAPPRTGWSILTEQFASLPVALLGGAAALSLVTGGLLDAAIIGGVVVLNSLIGFLTEFESERTISSHQQMGQPTAKVIRKGRTKEIPAEEIVPGDLVALEPGGFVGADLRIVRAEGLRIDESSLTGESAPVTKLVKALPKKDLPLADRVNMAFKGTLVTNGRGVGLVVATGANTQMGRLQLLLSGTSTPRSPIEMQLEQTGDHLVKLCGAVCGLVFFTGLARGMAVLEMLRVTISLAAAAIPEGLPAAATTTFSLGIMDMRKHGILVRRLHAVETLGALETVCFDKTGTVTENRMHVSRVVTADGRVDAQSLGPGDAHRLVWLLKVAVLCSEVKVNGTAGRGQELAGSPTENALVRLAQTCGIDVKALRRRHPLLESEPRQEHFAAMRTLHENGDGTWMQAVKGSPMVVLSLCDFILKDGKRVALTDEDRARIEAENDDMAGKAYRVLGTAFLEDETPEAARARSGLVWLGLTGLSDPIREGVPELIEVFHQAGVRTILITGDQSLTAYAVAEKLNLGKGEGLEILESTRLNTMDSRMLQALAHKVHVFSRVTPAHKLEIVQALQSTGAVVAMTGDGINDGPALKAADVGIAMGRGGTDVAREVADVILEHDDLQTLVLAVRDGRAISDNIRKSVHFFLSTNFSEIIVMLAATLSGMGSPLNTMQLLWINLISDIFPGLALSMEPPEPDVMKRPPRQARAPLFTRSDYTSMATEAGVISAGAILAYLWGLARYGAGARTGTLAFQSLTTAQLLHALNCRSRRRTMLSSKRLPANRALNASITASLAIQVLTIFVPGLRRLLGNAVLRPADIAVAFGTAGLTLAANELRKPA